MIHRLANLSSDFDGFAALAGLANDAARLVEGDLELSFASISRFDANMAAPLGAVLTRVADRNHGVSISDVLPLHEDVLSKNGFLGCFGFPPPGQQSATAIPYRRFKITDTQPFYDYLETYLLDKGLPEMTNDFPLRLQMCLGEVFANAETHSDSSLGVFVCGQFYPTEQRLVITIADAGITIPERFHRRFGIQ